MYWSNFECLADITSKKCDLWRFCDFFLVKIYKMCKKVDDPPGLQSSEYSFQKLHLIDYSQHPKQKYANPSRNLKSTPQCRPPGPKSSFCPIRPRDQNNFAPSIRFLKSGHKNDPYSRFLAIQKMFLEKILKLGKNALKHRLINDFGPGGQLWRWILRPQNKF